MRLELLPQQMFHQLQAKLLSIPVLDKQLRLKELHGQLYPILEAAGAWLKSQALQLRPHQMQFFVHLQQSPQHLVHSQQQLL
jgi:hypothetical protein